MEIKGKAVTVRFQDCGQEFAEWDIEKGIVTDSRPHQAELWKGCLVKNKGLAPGDYVQIVLPRDNPDELLVEIKYPVAFVVKKGNRP